MDSKNTISHQKRVMINVPLSVYYLELVLWPVLLHCLQVFGVEGACFFRGWGFGPPPRWAETMGDVARLMSFAEFAA